MKETVHDRVEVVVDTICIDKYSDRSPREKRSPPPLVILRVEVEVSEENGQGSGQEKQQYDRENQDTIEFVNMIIGPNGLENEFKFNIYGPKSDEASDENLESHRCEKIVRRNFASKAICSCGKRFFLNKFHSRMTS